MLPVNINSNNFPTFVDFCLNGFSILPALYNPSFFVPLDQILFCENHKIIFQDLGQLLFLRASRQYSNLTDGNNPTSPQWLELHSFG